MKEGLFLFWALIHTSRRQNAAKRIIFASLGSCKGGQMHQSVLVVDSVNGSRINPVTMVSVGQTRAVPLKLEKGQMKAHW